MIGRLRGGEMAGHGESYESSLAVEFQSAEEAAAGTDPWRAWYARDKQRDDR